MSCFLQDQWNGITSKKKGQKWGREKHTFTPRNDNKDSLYEILSNAKDKLSDEGIDFDKLPPLVDVPKVDFCLSLHTFMIFYYEPFLFPFIMKVGGRSGLFV